MTLEDPFICFVVGIIMGNNGLFFQFYLSNIIFQQKIQLSCLMILHKAYNLRVSEFLQNINWYHTNYNEPDSSYKMADWEVSMSYRHINKRKLLLLCCVNRCFLQLETTTAIVKETKLRSGWWASSSWKWVPHRAYCAQEN